MTSLCIRSIEGANIHIYFIALQLLWMAANGIIFGLAYQNFDNSLEYYYLRAILKVWNKVTNLRLFSI